MSESINIGKKAPETISYYEHEEEVFRLERHSKRLFIALIICVILLFASNMAWLTYESLYDTISYSQDGEGVNNINTGEQGDVTRYVTEAEDKDTQR